MHICIGFIIRTQLIEYVLYEVHEFICSSQRYINAIMLFNLYWGTKVWNIDINFVVFKKQIKK